MTYTLKDVDLASAHKSGAWMTEPRLRDGRWTTGASGLWKGQPVGKHSRFKDPERDIADSYHGVTVKDDQSFSSVDWDGLMTKAADPSALPTEREQAVKQVTLHLEQMKRKVQVETANYKSTTTMSHTSSKITVKPVVKTVAKDTGHFVKDTASDASRVALTLSVLSYAVRAAAAAAALLGAHESEHMVEALHKIAENPAIESGVNVALTLLITMLIAKIQKAFRDRHDRRVAKARGEIL